MKKFSITMVSLATMAGLAVAQAPKADPKAGAGSAAPKAPAAGSGAGSAKAPAAGAGAGSAKAPAAGSAAGAAAGSAAAPPKMEMPKPPAEVKDALKAMGTRQTCTGLSWGPDKTEMKAKGTGTNALALDGWAIKSAMNMTMGEGKSKMTFKMEGYMTYDTKLGKWHSISASNDGSVMVGLTEMKDGKLEGVSDMMGGMMGNGKFRDHGDMTDPKAGMKMWGEMSMDGGKTWTKVYEMVCKK